MDQHQLAVLVALVAVVVVVIAVGYLLMRKRRSQVLRNRFGPEYDRVVKHEGDTTESSARALALTPKKALNEWLHDERAPRLPGSHEVRVLVFDAEQSNPNHSQDTTRANRVNRSYRKRLRLSGRFC